MPQLLEQKRAEYALTCVNRVRGNPDLSKKYKIYVHSLPAMVQVNGLGQALAQIMSDFRKADDGPAARQVMNDLKTWLVDRRRLYEPPNDGSILQALVTGDRAAYLRAYEETIALCNWLKKLTDAYVT